MQISECGDVPLILIGANSVIGNSRINNKNQLVEACSFLGRYKLSRNGFKLCELKFSDSSEIRTTVNPGSLGGMIECIFPHPDNYRGRIEYTTD